MKYLLFMMLSLQLCGCSSVKEYESDVFPEGKWYPVNPEHFGKTEAQRLIEGVTKP